MPIPRAEQIVQWFTEANDAMSDALSAARVRVMAALARGGAAEAVTKLLEAEEDRLRKLVERVAALQQQLSQLTVQ